MPSEPKRKKGGREKNGSTHVLHQQVEFVDVAELLQLLECEAQVARSLVHQCFHGDQVITQELQPGDVALLSQAHQRQGAVHLAEPRKRRVKTFLEGHGVSSSHVAF